MLFFCSIKRHSFGISLTWYDFKSDISSFSSQPCLRMRYTTFWFTQQLHPMVYLEMPFFEYFLCFRSSHGGRGDGFVLRSIVACDCDEVVVISCCGQSFNQISVCCCSWLVVTNVYYMFAVVVYGFFDYFDLVIWFYNWSYCNSNCFNCLFLLVCHNHHCCCFCYIYNLSWLCIVYIFTFDVIFCLRNCAFPRL